MKTSDLWFDEDRLSVPQITILNKHKCYGSIMLFYIVHRHLCFDWHPRPLRWLNAS